MQPVTAIASSRGTQPPRRIVVTTLGSLGDLYPFAAIALELQARGHEVRLATSPCHRQRVEALGLAFRAVRPDSLWTTDREQTRRLTDPWLGLFRIGTEWVLPALRESYQDTLAAAAGADLLISHPICYAARLVAETTGTRWASSMIVPFGFFSAYDVPASPLAPALWRVLRRLGPRFWRPFLWSAKRATRFLARPWYRLRAELGLVPTAEANPLGDGHSPLLVLALFSELLGARQPDWPAHTVITGFPFHDRDAAAGLPPALARFLEAGPPPVVFTLGSAVAADPGLFYEHSMAAAVALGRRAVLISGDPHTRPPVLPDGVVAFPYAPFATLFPRAAVVVHHGGVGTTGLAMRAGRPMLVVPCAWDQPDNAERVVRLGIARTLARRHYAPARVAGELRRLLDDPAYTRRAAEVAARVRQENGVATACDAAESILG